MIEIEIYEEKTVGKKNKTSLLTKSRSKSYYDNEDIKYFNKSEYTLLIDKANKFTWPDSNNNFVNDSGYCYALKDQIAILVDGTIVPCCLDGEGEINLGNIFNENLENVLSTERVDKMIKGFRNRKVEEKLCKHCNFKNKF
jgi:radical SAM protein with 4Fe4S-binding SPASM domain